MEETAIYGIVLCLVTCVIALVYFVMSGDSKPVANKDVGDDMTVTLKKNVYDLSTERNTFRIRTDNKVKTVVLVMSGMYGCRIKEKDVTLDGKILRTRTDSGDTLYPICSASGMQVGRVAPSNDEDEVSKLNVMFDAGLKAVPCKIELHFDKTTQKWGRSTATFQYEIVE